MVVILNNKAQLALNIPVVVEINRQFSRHHKHIKPNNLHRLQHQNNLIKKFSRQPRRRRAVMEVAATEGKQQNLRQQQLLRPLAIDFRKSKRKHRWWLQIRLLLKLKQLPLNRFESSREFLIILTFRMTEERPPRDHRHYLLPYLQMEFLLHNSNQLPKNLLAVANNITTCSSNQLMSIY